VTLFSNYSTSFGAVQNTQLNSLTPNNPLTPEVAKTIEAGARFKGSNLSAEVTVFDIRFDNQINQIPNTTPALFQNIGKTQHDGIETSLDYSFDKDSVLRGLNLYATYTYTRAVQKSGTTPPMDVGLGEAAIGITFSHDGLKPAYEGYPVAMSFPKDGTGYEIGCMALIKNGPAREVANGKRFIDWMLSKRGQNLFETSKSFRIPVNTQATPPKGAISVDSLKVIKL